MKITGRERDICSLKNCLVPRLLLVLILSLYLTGFGAPGTGENNTASSAGVNATSPAVFAFSAAVPGENSTFILNTTAKWSAGNDISVEKRYNRMSDEVVDTIVPAGEGESILCYFCVPRTVNGSS